nr:MAG TPA: Protein of unknown function (DUF2089) [Caudoviricetes sp.]
MYKKICKRCGEEFIARTSKATYCSNCVTAIKSDAFKAKMRELNRPLTPDTEFLVCIYTARGDSISRIAIDLRRSKENVLKILNEAKASGRYEEHIKCYMDYAGDIKEK